MTKKLSAILIIVLLCPVCHCQNLSDGTFWQCTAKDKKQQSWQADSDYQRVAQNTALDFCKKQSPSPESCTAPQINANTLNME